MTLTNDIYEVGAHLRDDNFLHKMLYKCIYLIIKKSLSDLILGHSITKYCTSFIAPKGLATFVLDVLLQCLVIVGREEPKMGEQKIKDEGQGSGSKAESELYNLSYLTYAFMFLDDS